MQITQYKEINKNSLQGIFTLEVPKWGGFQIREMRYFKKDSQRWVSFPQKEYEKDGEKKYYAYNSFKDAETLKSFQEKVLEALDKHLGKSPSNEDFEF